MSPTRTLLDRSWREFSQRLYSAQRGEIDFGLARIERALRAEGHPDRSSRAILVAGTNGKGETAAFLAGILRAHGHRVGLFTSPHLIDLRERFRIDGRPVSRERAREIAEPLVDRWASELSFFELTTLIATAIFDRASVDFAIYEVGMGGRLDATNAIDPDLSVVTSIGRDHEMFLGSTIEEIAEEKSGILRSETPGVVGHQEHATARRVLEDRLATGTGEAKRAGEEFSADESTGEIRVDGRTIAPFEGQQLPGVAIRNAATAAQAAQLLLGAIDPAHYEQGLRRTRWPGRHDIRTASPERFDLARPVEMLLDAAHNPEAVEALLATVAEGDFEVASIVVGGMTDKDLGSMFGRLAGGPPVWGAEIDGPRAARGHGLQSIIPDDVRRGVGPVDAVLEAALDEAADTSQTGGVLVFGSTYLIGACLERLGVEVDELVTWKETR